jgi:hypothetical protein
MTLVSDVVGRIVGLFPRRVQERMLYEVGVNQVIWGGISGAITYAVTGSGTDTLLI